MAIRKLAGQLTGRIHVHLVIADTHFGRSDASSERRKELDLIACLRSFEADVRSLYLLGDIFECFIEYRHLVPRGFIRFQSLLAEWTDRGIEIIYFAGNHDPWHVDYVSRELGVRVVFDELVADIDGRRTFVHHGDGIALKSRLYNRIRPLLRHPVPVWMYRNLLPGDSGMRLALKMSAILGDEEVDEGVARDLRQHSRRLIDDGYDQVVMGHSHLPEVATWSNGRYLNPGSWHEFQTLLRLEGGAAELFQWNGEVCEAYHAQEAPAA